MNPNWQRPRYQFPNASSLRGGRYHRDHVSQANAMHGVIRHPSSAIRPGRYAALRAAPRAIGFSPHDLNDLAPIGFWAPTPNDTTEYPWPQAHSQGDQYENFLTAYLLGCYAPVVKGMSYRGWSTCRLCGRPNGSSELHDGTYYWPAGLAHYVRYHHVQLPRAFVLHAIQVAQPPARPALARCAPLFPTG